MILLKPATWRLPARRLVILNARRGLGNRVRAWLSCEHACRRAGWDLHVLWLPNRYCDALISDLWVKPSYLREIAASRARWVAKAGGGWQNYLGDLPRDLADFVGHRRILAVHSSQEFSGPGASSWPSLLRDLTPVPSVIERCVETWRHRPAERMVGVMVRTAADAHVVTAASDPAGYAVGRLDEMLGADRDLGVFCSTDAVEFAVALSERYPGRVQYLHDKGPFNSPKGLRDAMCDLYLLASCGHIIGSHYSSFSDLAAHLAGPVVPYETALRAPSHGSGAATRLHQALR